MPTAPVVICLPIADRATSLAFYRDGFGLEAFGEIADDGVPEPLQFNLNAGVRIMLIPANGFGWTIGDHQVAAAGISECVVTLTADSAAEVDARIQQAQQAGATVVLPPEQRPWGYVGTVADPDGHLWSVIVAP